MYNGILNIYKERDYTSHDVVARLRGILHQKKIGHTGTLDPMAEGVLVVCLGRATRLCDMLTDKRKVYEAEFVLGLSTDSYDITGTPLKESPVSATDKEIADCIHGFLGEQMQLPPMYSAVKVNGKRLYQYARKGETVERTPRRVIFYNIDVSEINIPRVKIRVTCSKGTYIRSLIWDIGERLGCGATLTGLKRTASGEFTADTALTLDKIQELQESNDLRGYIVPIEKIYENCPKVQVIKDCNKVLYNGNKVPIEGCRFTTGDKEGQLLRVYDYKGEFMGVYIKKMGYLTPEKFFYERQGK